MTMQNIGDRRTTKQDKALKCDTNPIPRNLSILRSNQSAVGDRLETSCHVGAPFRSSVVLDVRIWTEN